MKPFIKICSTVYDQSTWEESVAKASCAKITKEKSKLSFDFVVSIARTTIIEEGRNILINEDKDTQAIQQTLNKKYSHWLFVDHDVGFFPENIERLLSLDKQIISGCYRPKEFPERFVAGNCDKDGRIFDILDASTAYSGVLKVGWVGAGFLLCKRSALEKMQYPWYWKGLKIYNNRVMTIGEDVYFCINAAKNDIDIIIDTNTILNHEANRYNVNV